MLAAEGDSTEGAASIAFRGKSGCSMGTGRGPLLGGTTSARRGPALLTCFCTPLTSIPPPPPKKPPGAAGLEAETEGRGVPSAEMGWDWGAVEEEGSATMVLGTHTSG